MELKISGSPKEIAALVLALPERREDIKLERGPYERYYHLSRVEDK